MENFSEVRFPTDISYGMSGGPIFNTEIVENATGQEYRNIRSHYPRHRYNLASAIRTDHQLEELINFFKIMKGKAIAFRFKDWLDYRAINQEIARCDSVSSKFQLIKQYSIGNASEIRKISKPVKNTVIIFINNQIVKEFEVDYSKGTVELNFIPKDGDVITANFEFDVPVRFDNDYLPITIQNFAVQLVNEINLIEVLL